nr:UBN2 domain-containing protein [Tanacetum cinerariifolium]
MLRGALCNLQVKTYKIDLLTQEYEKSSISTEETIGSDFTRFNTIVTSLKSFDPEYSSKNHAKDLGTFPLDEIIGDLKVYNMVLDNDGVDSKTTKENVKSLALKAKVTKEHTSDDSDSQGGSDEDMDEEEEAEVLNLMAMNFCKFFHKGNRFRRCNWFGNGANRFGRGYKNSFGNKGGESSGKKGVCYNCGVEG